MFSALREIPFPKGTDHRGTHYTVFNSITTMQLTALTVTQVYLEKTMNILIHWMTID